VKSGRSQDLFSLDWFDLEGQAKKKKRKGEGAGSEEPSHLSFARKHAAGKRR